MKKIISALAVTLLTSGLLYSQNLNFSSKGFHLSADPYFIDCSAKLPDGKFLISGSFHRFHNKPIANLIRFNSDGELDTTFNLDIGTDHTIFAMSGTRAIYNRFKEKYQRNILCEVDGR